MRKRTLSKTLGFALLLMALPACGDGAEDPAAEGEAPDTTAPEPVATPAANSDVVAQGQELFHGAGICFSCHGQEGIGTPLGPNLSDAEWLWVTNPEQDLQTQLVTLITNGVPTPREFPSPMPPLGGASLSADQVASLAAYVGSLNQ